jgi:serine/threonine protein kinase
LHHPNICAVYDMAKWQGRPFLVMELLNGTTLGQRMKGGRIRPEGIPVIGVPVLNALEAAHHLGIVHRDIKPANLFLTRTSGVKVLDFGLAKVRAGFGKPVAATDATSVTFVTMPGTLLGTLCYMSPEQVRGELLDGRADLYSFGVVMYEALTGQLPTRENGKLPITEPLQSFLGRLIEPERNARFGSAGEARDALTAMKF